MPGGGGGREENAGGRSFGGREEEAGGRRTEGRERERERMPELETEGLVFIDHASKLAADL
jgi:hypothetical protein